MNELAVQGHKHHDLKSEISNTVRKLSAIPYFPKDDDEAIKAVMEGISRFVDTVEGVRWLIATAVDRMREWGGVAGLREIWEKASQQAYLERLAKEADKLVAEWRKQSALESPGATLPVPKTLPAISRTDSAVLAMEGRRRLADVCHERMAIHIPSTPVRTPEQRQTLETEIFERIRERRA